MNQEEYVENLLNILQKNRYVQSFMRKNHLDFSFVEKNSDYFLDWISNIDKCENCPGIEFCSQKIKGRVKNIYMDGKYLETSYVPCRYKKKKESEIVHKNNFRLSNLTDEEYKIDLQKIDIASQSPDYVMAYAQTLKSIENSKGIYLFGQPGVGKTYLMIALANQYAKNGKKVSFVKVPQMIQEYKDNMTDSEYTSTILSHLKYSEVLFLDDIGSESISQWTRDSILFPVLNHRMDHNLKTYLTSNYTMSELQKQYYLKGKDDTQVASMRLMERIRALSNSLALKGESRR